MSTEQISVDGHSWQLAIPQSNLRWQAWHHTVSAATDMLPHQSPDVAEPSSSLLPVLPTSIRQRLRSISPHWFGRAIGGQLYSSVIRTAALSSTAASQLDVCCFFPGIITSPHRSAAIADDVHAGKYTAIWDAIGLYRLLVCNDDQQRS